MAKPAPTPQAAPSVKGAEFGQPYCFRLQMHLKGPFSGQSLWELARVDTNGMPIKIIADADKLENCLDNLVGELQADGY